MGRRGPSFLNERAQSLLYRIGNLFLSDKASWPEILVGTLRDSELNLNPQPYEPKLLNPTEDNLEA